MFALAAACALPDALAQQSCALKKLASIKLNAPGSGVPVVTGLLDDTERQFIVDTGSPFSGIDSRVAEELGLTRLPITRIELYSRGKQLDYFARVKRVRLGTAEVSRMAMVLMPSGSLPSGIDGLIGGDFLSVFDVDFDFGQHTLNLMSREHCKGDTVYWTAAYTSVPFYPGEGRQLFIDVTLDGKTVSALIDTGTTHTTISESAAVRDFGTSEAYHFGEMSFEGVAVRHPAIGVRKDLDERAFAREHNDKGQWDLRTRQELERADVHVGMNILESLHLYVCYDQHRIFISPANAH